MKGLNTVISSLTEVIDDLKKAGYAEMASTLEGRLSEIEKESNSLDALKYVERMCHPKALGDFYMAEFEGWSWFDKVEKLGENCRRVINRSEETT
jgi:hypothetical protein